MILKNFIDLTKEEHQMIISWRNNENIRKWMYNKTTISLDEHLKFIKSLKVSLSSHYFLLKSESSSLGVIYLTKNFLGVYSNPNKKKVGDILLKEIIKFAFETKKLSTLKAEVYTDNYRAIKLYKRFGFKKNFEQNNLITMELKNENR